MGSKDPALAHLQKMGTPSRLGMTVGREFFGLPYRVYKWILEVEKRVLDAIVDPQQRIIILNVPPQVGKGLRLSEEVPTPVGWRRFGDLVVGDELFGRDGEVCRVTGIFDRGVQPFRRVHFTDGTHLDADTSHLWHVRDRKREVGRSPRQWWEGTVSTEEMEREVTLRGGRKRWAVPVMAPLQGPDVSLPVDPWILGYWLGNGHTGTRLVSGHLDDAGYVSERLGANWKRPKADVLTFSSVVPVGRPVLREAGVLTDKHVPMPYLRSSEAQRRQLLAGLMDSDGYTGGGSGGCELCFTNKRLADDAEELIRSLGEKMYRRESPAAYRKNGERIVTGTRYRLTWTPRTCPAESPRKIAMWKPKPADTQKGDRLEWRYVERIEVLPDEPSRCIRVDAADSLFVAGRDFIVSHNTTWTMLLACWYLGMNPFHQVLLMTYSDEYSGSWGEKARQLLKRWGPELFGVHVSSTLDSKGNWKLNNGFGGMVSVGIGSGISGISGHLILIDDLIAKMEDAASVSLLAKHVTEFDGSISSRFQDPEWDDEGNLVRSGTTVVITATRFADGDLSGTLIERSRQPGYTGTPIEVIAIPAIAEIPDDEDVTMSEEDEEAWRDFLDRAAGEALTCRYSQRYFEQRRADLSDDDGEPGFIWQAVYQQNPGSKSHGMFPADRWRYWDAGNMVPVTRRVRAWDLAATAGGGDYTVGTLFGLGADGKLYVLDRIRGRWSTSDVEAKVLETASRDGFLTKILIEQEKAGAGKALVEYYQRKLVGYTVEPAKAEGSKEQRCTPYSTAQQINKVLLPSSWKRGGAEAHIGKEWIGEHSKMMGDGRRPRHDDQIDTGAYCALDLLGQGLVELWLPHEHSMLNGTDDPRLLAAMSSQRDPDEPRKQTSPFAARRKALLAGMR